jgi:hypothetical protein
MRQKVLLPFTLVELFCRKVMFLTLEKSERYAVFLSKSTSILIGKQWARHSYLNLDGFCRGQTVLLPFT